MQLQSFLMQGKAIFMLDAFPASFAEIPTLEVLNLADASTSRFQAALFPP
jgi:hypothetical protein